MLGFFLWLTYRQTQLATETAVRNVVTSVSNRVEASIHRIESTLEETSSNMPRTALSSEAASQFRPQIENSLRQHAQGFPELVTYRIYGADGGILYRGDSFPLANATNRPHFIQLQQNPTTALHFSETFFSSAAQHHVMVVAKVVLDSDSAFTGLIQAPLNLDYFFKLFSELNVGKLGIISIRRTDDSRLVVRWPEVAGELNEPAEQTEAYQLIQAGEKEGVVRYVTKIDQVERIIAFHRVSNYPFYIVAGMAVSEQFALWKQIALFSTTATAALLLLLGYFLGRMRQSQVNEDASESRFRRIFESSPDAVWVMQNHRFVEGNSAAATLFGYGSYPKAFLNVHPADISPQIQPDGEESSSKAERMMNLAEAQGLHRFEWRHRRTDGHEFFAEVTLSTFTLNEKPALYAVVRDITRLKRVTEDLERHRQGLEALVSERTEQLRHLAKELTLAEERERQTIARDLHDDLGQMLYVVRLKLDSLMATAAQESRAPLGELTALVVEASHMVRSLTSQLAPPILFELGLVPALGWLAEEIERNHGLLVDIEADGTSKPLGTAPAAFLFRTLRELLINVSKHAATPRAHISVRTIADQLELTVKDCGIGVADLDAALAGRRGFGLASIRERITFLGGAMEILTAPGDGTTVIIKMPIEPTTTLAAEAPA